MRLKMDSSDLRILCTALGFTAVAIQGDKLPKVQAALRAKKLSNLIEEFCHAAVPEAFNDDLEQQHQSTRDLINQMTSALELCLECDGKLTWEVEQEAQALV